MGFNRFGKIFQWTTFGESHGPSMGVVIDGCPSGVDYNEGLLLKNLALRRPGGDPSQKTKRVSQRKEKDIPRVLSGVWENKTLGTPIAVQVENQDSRSKDYEYLKNHPRPGHADDLWKGKFKHWDHRGGGRASARETVNWVIAGSFAQMFCLSQKKDIKVKTQIVSIGPMKINQVKWAEVEEMLAHAEKIGESYGGIVGVEVLNPPPFLGEPIFHKIKAQMAHAFMSINACCGVELGGGFAMAWEKGSHIHRGPDSSLLWGSSGRSNHRGRPFCSIGL